MGYFDIKAISNSSLNYIDPESGGNPRLFRKFLDGDIEDVASKSFELGTLIHEELLEPGKLDILLAETPGPKTQVIIDALWQRLFGDAPLDEPIGSIALTDLSEPTWEAVIPEDFYPKYTLQTKINRVVKDGNEYWQALFTSRGKKIVDPATYHIVQGCVESIRMHEVAKELIEGLGFDAYEEAHEELEITYDIPYDVEGQTVTMPIKAKIDRILVDHKKKSIVLVDLKTTASPLGRFEETVAKYRYYRQLAYYRMCLEERFAGYTVDEIYIVAVQTNKEYPCDVFKIDDSYMQAGQTEYSELLDRIAFHLARNNWGNSMETQLGQIHCLVLPEDDRTTTKS